MRVRTYLSLLFAFCFVTILPAAWGSQSAGSAGAQAGTKTVVLGNATVPLDGLWKFHIGDNMAWAQPGFDDSAWGAIDLTPPPGSYDLVLGSSGFVPGWTARGYKGYSGYAWYRLQVNIEGNQSALSLKMPDEFDDAYQVYVNGQQIGQFGRFTSKGVTAYNALPRAFPLPASLRSGPATLAIRMWMDAYSALVDPDVGGLHAPPVLGQAGAIAGLLQLGWDTVNRSNYSVFAQMAILLLALVVAFALYGLDPSELAYLWLGLVCAANLALAVVNTLANYSTVLDGTLQFLLMDAILSPLIIGLWIIFWAAWFRLPRMGRIHGMVWSLAGLLAIGTAMLRAPLYGSVVPVHAIVWLSPLTLALKLLLGVLLLWVTVRGIHNDKTEGWLALPPVVLVIVSLYSRELLVLHLTLAWFPSGIRLSFGAIANMLSLLIITVLLLRRFLRSQREREQWRLEIEQARSVQQMLIPEALPHAPGLTIESEYCPAQQVGGDFFQILPHPTDHSVLIVVGDVTGHGLQAAMMVSLLVGAVRNQIETSFDPLAMLQSLNRRLLGREHANATCLALRIASDGACTLANAGHLPPYLNGKEMAMEGALPLGMVAGAEFSVMQFQLAPGDRLTLLTDGVIEAQNEQRELFGFDRTVELLHQQQSAAAIATAAQAFGQQDDITVVRVTRG